METFFWFRSESSEYWIRLADFGSWMVVVGVAVEVPGLFIRVVRSWPELKKLAKWTLKKLPSGNTDDSLVSHVEASWNEAVNNRLIAWISRTRDKALMRFKEIEALMEVWDFSWLLVVVLGLVLEVGANQRARRIDSRDNAALHAQAGEAQKSAGIANERATSNELQVSVFSVKLLELAHLYDLSTDALAEANGRLAAIKPAIDPWRISDTQSNILRETISLHPFATNNVWVILSGNSGELFCSDIFDILKIDPKAQKVPITAHTAQYTLADEYGISIFVNPNSQALGGDAQQWLLRGSYRASLKLDEYTPVNTTVLVVGKKPWISN